MADNICVCKDCPYICKGQMSICYKECLFQYQFLYPYPDLKVTNHNNHHRFSMIPMPDPIHNQEPTSSHKTDHKPNVHNGMVPSPSYNLMPMSIHKNYKSNDHRLNKVQNQIH